MKTFRLQAILIAIIGLLGSSTTYGQEATVWKATLHQRIDGFQVPECVVTDSRNGRVYVSNIEAEKDKYWDDDGKGFISLLAVDGTVKQLRWKDSTKNAAIHAPKGMCILGDQLYYTDNRRLMTVALSGKGAPKEIEVPGAVKLNDLATDGENIWGTDTGAGVVYRVDSSGNIHREAEIKAANGVTCHRGNVYVVSWELHEVYEITPDGSGTPISFNLAEHFTNLDGIEVLQDGSFVVSDFTGNRVSHISRDRKTVSTLIEIESPADIGIDRERGLLYVPGFMKNQVTVFELRATGGESE